MRALVGGQQAGLPLQLIDYIISPAVGVNSVFWSGARDLNPGPHGPEIQAVSSTEISFEGFEVISRLPQPI
jgi:hypothetical protein